MRSKAIQLAIMIVFAFAAWGQTPADQNVDRVFRFTHTGTPQGFQEVTNALRAITEMRNVSADATAQALTVQGTADQVSLAEWLFHALDQPASGQPTPTLEYRLTGAANPVVRVFYLTHTATPQGSQEIVNTLRSVLELQRVVVVFGPRALALRGTLEQSAGAEWLIGGLDKPAGVQPLSGAARLEYTLPGNSPAPVARLFYLRNNVTPQGLGDVVNTVRALADIQRLTVCNLPKALAMRGTADQVALSEWLIGKLDIAQPAQQPGAFEYPMPRSADGVVKVFYLSQNATPQGMQEMVNMIRSTAGIQRVVACATPRVLALRGSVDQVAQAERLIQERDKSSGQ